MVNCRAVLAVPTGKNRHQFCALDTYRSVRWTALSSTLRAPPAHRWMTNTVVTADFGSVVPLPLFVLLVHRDQLMLSSTTPVGGCARPPFARGELSRVGDAGGCVQTGPWFLLSTWVRDKQRSVGGLCRARVDRRRSAPNWMGCRVKQLYCAGAWTG